MACLGSNWEVGLLWAVCVYPGDELTSDLPRVHELGGQANLPSVMRLSFLILSTWHLPTFFSVLVQMIGLAEHPCDIGLPPTITISRGAHQGHKRMLCGRMESLPPTKSADGLCSQEQILSSPWASVSASVKWRPTPPHRGSRWR